MNDEHWKSILGSDADSLEPLVAKLSSEDGPADIAGTWPDRLWGALVEARATRWSIPIEFGGVELDRSTLLTRYARVAEGSLTAAFILSQHDASVRRLIASGPTATARSWLEKIAAGAAFTTVGISQLTTSQRRGTSALTALQVDGGYVLNGVMPWVTAAERASVIVTGAVIAESNEQLLIAVPTDRSGIDIRPAFDLAALQASRTTEVGCREVFVASDEILIGPIPDVMSAASKPGGTGGLETSALALGQARASIDALGEQALRREDLRAPLDALRRSWRDHWNELIAAASESPSAPPASRVRERANALVGRASQAYLTARKGSGFLRSDPAQRLARQALFFLVWSCPAPIAAAAIRDFAGSTCD